VGVDGLWTADFRTQSDAGTGVVVLTSGRIMGGPDLQEPVDLILQNAAQVPAAAAIAPDWSAITQEIMALLRQQNAVLADPEKFLAPVLGKLEEQFALAARLARGDEVLVNTSVGPLRIPLGARAAALRQTGGGEDYLRELLRLAGVATAAEAEKPSEQAKSDADAESDKKSDRETKAGKKK
jgi:hypothetical protein